MKVFKNLLYGVLLLTSLIFVFYRMNVYVVFKSMYPNDEVNISFNLLKIFREISIWILTISPIAFLTLHLVKKHNKINIILAIFQLLVHIILLTLIIIYCQQVNFNVAITLFVIYFIFIVALLTANVFVKKKGV